jgi:hypothetical protein
MPDNGVEQHLKEKSAREAARAAEIQKIVDAHDARMRKEAAEQKRKDDAAQAAREKRFDEELDAEARSLFYAGNPGAPESLWEAMREEFRGMVLRRRAEAAANQSHALYKW